MELLLITFLFLVISKTRTPYGRHSENGWGLMINNSWAWFWMEFPALVVMPFLSLIKFLGTHLTSYQFFHHFYQQ